MSRWTLTLAMSSLCAVITAADAFRVGAYDGYAPKELTDRFAAQVKSTLGRDITVTVVPLTDNQSVFDALRNKSVDVTCGTNNGIDSEKFKLVNKGLVKAVDLARIKNYADILPALQKPDFLTDSAGKLYGVPFNYGPFGLAYNTSVVKTAPMSWKVLVESGITFAVSKDWEQCMVATAALIAGVPKTDLFTFDKINTPAVKDVLKKLAATPKMWVGVDDAATLKGLHYATSWAFAFADLAKQGEVWAMAEPTEGSTGYVDSWLISSACAPAIDDIAHAWLDFAISPQTQAFYHQSISVKLVNPKAKAHLSPEEIRSAKLDDPNWFGRSIIMLKGMDIRSENGFKKLWEEAKTGK